MTEKVRTSTFLRKIWDLEGFYVIGIHKHDGGWEWYSADPEFAELFVERNKYNGDIYYSVNPRVKEPENGKGSDADIKQANTFFADLDFKDKEKKDCKPDILKDDPNTHELELCYEENGKTVLVHRPPLNEVLEKIEKAHLMPVTFVVDSGTGYQLIWKSSKVYDAVKWKEIEEEIIRRLEEVGLPVDKQVKDISRILRLPGSINFRSGREAKVIYSSDETITILPRRYEEIVSNLEGCFKKADDRRFEFVGHLSGYLAKSGVPLEDAELIVEELYRRAGISPPEHVRDVKYTYKDYSEGKPVTGFNHLKKLCEDELGVPINDKLFLSKNKKKKSKKKEKEEQQQEVQQTFVDEKPIQSFDVLKIYHDFQHEKAYVSTWKAVVRYVTDEDGNREPRNVVTIDKVYVNENGNIHALTEEEFQKLREEYIKIENIKIDIDEEPSDYLELNLPTEIKTDVKISEIYKKLLEFIKQRVTLKYEEDYVAVTVWTIGAYFYRMFLAYPYLAPQKMGYNSGGTELLWTLKKVLPRPEIFNDPTPASIYTSVEQKDVCQLFDEFRENVSKERIEEIKNILRAGYRKGGVIQRVVILPGGKRVTKKFDAYSPKVIIDQSLVTSEYDIASRCLFVWLVRDPNRKSIVIDERPKDLVNELYSVFLKYAPQAYSIYNNIESGLTGRYDQLFRALISLAQVIDGEDNTLKVTEQLYKALERSIEFSESIVLEGDPQKKVISLIIEYIRDSIGQYIEKKISKIESPWHVFEEGEGEVYIFVSDLRKKVTEYAVEVYQRDISYRLASDNDETQDEDIDRRQKTKQKLAVSEREWERVDPEIAEYLKDRKFTAILKKFFPENVRRHRDRNAFFLKFDDYSKIISLNFYQSPSKVASRGGYILGINKNEGFCISTQCNEQNTKALKSPLYIPPSDSNSDSEIKIQNTSTEVENSKSLGELSFNSSLQFSNNMPKSELIRATQIRLDSDSEIKMLSRENFKEGVEKNKATQDKTGLVQKIQNLLNKIVTRGNGSMPLKDLEQDELKLLSAMKERGLIDLNNESVWITGDGYLYLDGMSTELTVDKIIEKVGYKFTVEELRKAITEVTGCPTPDCVDDWIKTIKRVVMGRFRRTVIDFIKHGYQGELVKRRTQNI